MIDCSIQNFFQKAENSKQPREPKEGENRSSDFALETEHIVVAGPAKQPEKIRATEGVEQNFSDHYFVHCLGL